MTRTKIERTRHIRIPEFDNVTVDAAGTVTAIIPIAGLLRARLRCKLSVAGGTFAFSFIKPAVPFNAFPQDGSSLHTAGNPTDLTPAGTDEEVREITDLYGEAYLYIVYTDDGTGSTVEHVVFSAL